HRHVEPPRELALRREVPGRVADLVLLDERAGIGESGRQLGAGPDARIAPRPRLLLEHARGAGGKFMVELEERRALAGERTDRILVEPALRLQRAQRRGRERRRVAAVFEVVVIAEALSHAGGTETGAIAG